MSQSVKKLLAWYRQNGRDLPWRTATDPYQIFISEIMLQQTQVDSVIPKYNAFLKKFPSWKSLANATTTDLIHAWAGLGYNRRALYAREAAQTVVTQGVPCTEAEWRALKGIGPYAAAALTEFVNHKRAVVIDTNIRRIVGRVTLGKPYPELSDDTKIKTYLEKILPMKGAHWDVPQAYMDLANSICLPRTPKCIECPLRDDCLAAKKFLSGNVRKKVVRRVTERMHAEKKYPDRIYRGRILGWIRQHGPTPIAKIGTSIDETFDRVSDSEWVEAMIERLVKDGLLKRTGKQIQLPI